MNQLLLKEMPNGPFSVTGERALHIRTVLRSKAGDSLKVGLLNGLTGHARIVSVEKESILLDSFVFDTLAPGPLPIILAVALPRPQSLKKVLHFAASAGIPELLLFQSVRVEKSYWNSTLLRPENLESELTEGLEQGCATVLPELHFFRSFRAFTEYADTLPQNIHRIAAHPDPEDPFSKTPSAEKFLLTVGPEGGFVPSEIAALKMHGFQMFSCGRHILRVEFACAFLSGMLVHS